MRTRGVSSILILAATLAFGATASAETLRYKWRDAEGNLHYSDSLPSNAGVLGYDVVNSQGILVKRVAPAMSPEQRQAAKEQAKLETQRQNELEQQRREDQQLLAANPTEADLLNTQKDQLLTFDGQIKSVSITLESLERSLTDLLGRAAEHESAATAVPKKLRDQIAEVRSDIDSQHAEHDRLVRERAATEAGFGAQLDHFRRSREGGQENAPAFPACWPSMAFEPSDFFTTC
jgi:hypothetical protein